MARYAIRFKPSAARQFRKLDRPVQVRISSVVEALALNPRPSGVKKLQGGEGLCRIRVGDYRVVYRIMDGQMLVLVVRVGHRGEIYRDL